MNCILTARYYGLSLIQSATSDAASFMRHFWMCRITLHTTKVIHNKSRINVYEINSLSYMALVMRITKYAIFFLEVVMSMFRKILLLCLPLMVGSSLATAAQINVSSVSASSTWSTYNVNSLVNGNGLSGGLHSGVFSDKWMTDLTPTGWLTFSFDGIYSISSATVWNYGTGCCGENRSTKDLMISTSLDGITYSPLVEFVLSLPDREPFAGESISLSDVDAKFIRFDLLSNYGSDDYVGLSEVAFFGDLSDDPNRIPEPVSLALLGLGLAGLGFSRRKKA